MKKLSELIKKAWEKIKSLSKTKMIAAGIIILGIIVAAIILITVRVKDDSNYALLFNTQDATDAKTIVDILKTDNVSMKIKGNAIYVPKDQADQLRLEIAPQISSGSKGFELFDTQSAWGTTDKEMDIQTQRAIQGELERTIKSYPQIKNAKVLLVLSSNSILVQDPQQASASVALTLKDGYDLSTKQVKAIVALIKGAVPNLLEKNVQITDQNLKNLTENLYNTDGSSTSSTDEQAQQDYKNKREAQLQTSVLSMLESVYGKGKVKVTVNTDINFDAVKETTTSYDGNNPILSRQESSQTTGNSTSSQNAQSPNDASQSSAKYPIVGSDSNTGSSSNSSTTNYSNSHTDSTTIKAAGDVKRLTVSAVVDKTNLTTQEQGNIRDMIKDAVGYDEKRGDSITVVGMSFDSSSSSDLQGANSDAVKVKESSVAMRNYIFIGVGLAGLFILLTLLKAFKKKVKKQDEEDLENTAHIDAVIGDEIKPKEPEIQFNPIDFEPKNDENSHVEKEIKKYASNKPEQVVDIIKSWLTEEER